MEILDEQKKKIATDLYNYVQNQADGSANKASQMLTGVSNATISNVLNAKWEKVADTMWQNIQNQVSVKGEWVYVDSIRPSKFIEDTIAESAKNAAAYGIVAIAGGCKSKSITRTKVKNVFTVSCNEYFSSRDLLEEICDAMGITVHSNRISKIMKSIIKHVLKLKNPVIILDEADKLDKKVLYFYISFYNQLENKCSLIMIATEYLETMIVNGVENGRKGFQEIYSRMGQIFLKVPKINKNDCLKVCKANGLYDELIITDIFNNCNGDMRVVKDMVRANLKKTA